MKINKIKISGFKSIADVELNDLTPFSVFAGANGAGKSNFFDALKFLSTVVTLGATQAIRQFHGYDNIHCFKHRKNKARMLAASFGYKYQDREEYFYLKISDMDNQPKLEEFFFQPTSIAMADIKAINTGIDINYFFGKTKKVSCVWIGETRKSPFECESNLNFSENLPDELSCLMLNPHWSIAKYLKNIRVYRFDPLGAKEPDNSGADTTELHSHGHNIATMLSVLEKDAEIREQIIEWMELLVPSLETVSTERSRFDSTTLMKFKEAGVKKQFPVHLISDGTIYALCIMVAVLSRCKQPGMTLIEEPERGIHPQAIAELVSLMRENANPNHAIFVTTHSESVVRHSKPEELWLVNKIDGKTEFKNAGKKFSNLGDLSLDKAWLMNFFGGGLPW